ncbi:type II toxin-antitoxin system VapC family toxin [Salibacterium aidingense]|uniref:type II toxin-antitoxin system VapC family toxin n=1 Tax=Salibacterium aidingense TaxID=384933 RepID=UPI0004079C89|nr:PIN domain-containing protein [Salibacterium aidingense]
MKSKACFVDSSALIALNLPKDQYHDTAVQIAETLGEYQYLLSETVLNKTYTLLRSKSGFPSAWRFINTVIDHSDFEIVEITDVIRKETITLLEKYSDHRLSYCDAQSAAIMKEKKIEHIFAFDRHFEIMGFSLFPIKD